MLAVAGPVLLKDMHVAADLVPLDRAAVLRFKTSTSRCCTHDYFTAAIWLYDGPFTADMVD
jgi:hypothetical protein